MAKAMRKSIYGRQLGLADDGTLVGAGRATGVTFTPAAGSTNVSLVTLQVVDNEDAPVAGVRHMDVYLSDAATGAGLTATTASGAVAAGASGVDLVVLVAKKATRVQTDATGKYILSITDSAKTLFYPCAVLGEASGAIVGAKLVTGNYG